MLEIDFGQDTPHVFMPSSDAGGRTELRATVAVTPEPRHAPWLRFHARVPGPRPAHRRPRAAGAGAGPLGHLRHRRHGEEDPGARPAADAAQHLRPPLRGRAGHGRALPARWRAIRRRAFTISRPARSSCCRPLGAFLRDAGFPPGSMHLRESTTLRTLIPGEGESRAHKLAGIARLMDDFPRAPLPARRRLGRTRPRDLWRGGAHASRSASKAS